MRYFSGYIKILKVDQILRFFYGNYFDCLDSRNFAIDEYAPYLLLFFYFTKQLCKIQLHLCNLWMAGRPINIIIAHLLFYLALEVERLAA